MKRKAYIGAALLVLAAVIALAVWKTHTGSSSAEKRKQVVHKGTFSEKIV